MSELVAEHRDAGFTLIELLVAVMIEALIVGALGVAFVGILRGTTQVNQSLSQSGDARNVAAYLVSDAGNSSGPETALMPATLCGTATSPAPGSIPFRFTWSSSSSTGLPPTANSVDYVMVPTVPATVPVSYTLVRRQCQNGVFVSAHTLAQNVLSVVPACSPTADCSGDPTSITVTIIETTASSGAGYTYSLTGAFQQLIGAGAPGNPKSVILLGANGACSGSSTINMSGSGAMRVYGEADLNTSDGSCYAMSMSGSGSFQAGNTAFYGNGSCHKTGSAKCPLNVSSNPAFTPDPYAGLSAPTTSGTPSACVGGVAHPGLFTSQFSISGSGSCQLASGVYILPFGFSVSGSATITSAPGGVLLYITGGGFDVSGSQTINLSSLTTGPYAGEPVVWEPASNPTSSFSFSGSGSLTLNGAVYAPKTAVQLSGSGVTPIVNAIVVKSISLSGSGSIDVGAASTTPLSIDPITATSWPIGQPYSTTLTGAGGDGSLIWAASNLPSPLKMDPDTGTISGTPNAAGPNSVTVTLNDALGDDPATPRTYMFTIDALPTVAGTTPSSGGQGAVSENVVINGTGFINGAALDSSFSGTGITVNSTNYNSPTSITANISIAAGASTGARDVTVTNGDTGVGAPGTGKFTVNAKPTVTSTSPTPRGQGATQSVTITGTGFVSGAALASSFGSGITVNSTVYGGPTSLTANITIAAGAATGAHDVTVTNGDSGVGTGTGKFTVNAGPLITTTSPLLSGEKSVSQSWTLTESGGTAPYNWTVTSGAVPAGLVLSSGGVLSGIPTGSGLSNFGVTITDAVGGTTTANLALTINPQPTITNVQFVNKTAGGTGTAGKIEQGDQIVVTFSAQMNAHTICSTWADGTADRSLSVNTTVVTLANGSGTSTDTMTMVAPGCPTFHFGTISLGSNLYVGTANATFGSSAGITTMAWSASGRSLTITLGKQAGSGVTATVATSTPTFTLSNSITDAPGAAVSNLTPAFPAAGKQF